MPASDHEAPERDESGRTPRLALTHGQTLWLLGELGLRQDVSASTFNSYIKSLRKLGVPFDKGKGRPKGRRHVPYGFEELMELTLALLLRVYGWLPDDVVAGLRSYRADLHAIYRQAYLDSFRPVYPAARIVAPTGGRLAVDGLFLDLNIRYAAGRLVEFGPPRTLSPFEALSLYARSGLPARSYLPLNVTAVAELIVHRARAIPPARQGRAARRSAR